MQIPELLLGKPRDVSRRARRVWRDFTAGESLERLSTIDSRDAPRYIVLERYQSQVYADESNFQLFTIFEAGVEDVPRKVEALLQLFDVMLGTPWGALGLLDDAVNFLKVDNVRTAALLTALARYWPTYMDLGNRFTPNMKGMNGRNLWDVSVRLRALVICHGVPESELPSSLPASLPNDDLREFMRARPAQYQDILASLGE